MHQEGWRKTSEEGIRKIQFLVKMEYWLEQLYNLEDPHKWEVSRFNFNCFQSLSRLCEDMEALSDTQDISVVSRSFLRRASKIGSILQQSRKFLGFSYKCTKEQGLLMPLMSQLILWLLNNSLKLKEQKKDTCYLSFL